MKELYTYIGEGLLSDIDDTLNNTDAVLDDMCKLHWRYSQYDEKLFRNIPGGIGSIFKKHFPKKLVPIESYMLRYGLCKNVKKLPGKIVYKNPVIDYLVALILNTKLPKPMDSYNFYHYETEQKLKQAITDNLNKYMLEEWVNFKTEKNNWPVLTASVWIQQRGIKIQIYYHQNDIKHESQLLCEILLRKTNEEE